MYTKEFQKFINGPSGPGYGNDALIYICKLMEISLIDG